MHNTENDNDLLHKHNSSLTPRAQELRRDMTPQERKLWYLFLQKHPVRFMRQKVRGRYIADFYCAKGKLVIEVDGSQHLEESAIAYDEERTEYLNRIGLHVLRFTNRQVEYEFAEVCATIDRVLRTPPVTAVTSPHSLRPLRRAPPPQAEEASAEGTSAFP